MLSLLLLAQLVLLELPLLALSLLTVVTITVTAGTTETQMENKIVILQKPVLCLPLAHSLLDNKDNLAGNKQLEPLNYAKVAVEAFVFQRKVEGCILSTTSLLSHCLGKGERMAFVLRDVEGLLSEGSLVSHGGQDLALGGPCPGWRQQRGAARGALARAGTQLGPLLWLQGQELCEELRSHGGAPLDPFEVFTFHTCSTIARLLFGDLVPPPGELRAFSCCLGELLQVWGRSTVRALDLLPPLRALPNPGLRELLRLVQRRDAFVEAQIRRHQECPSPPSDTVLGALLGRDPGVQGAPLSPLRLHMALVDLFIGGTETTAAALGWAVAFLLHRPELQARLRAELRGLQGPPGPGDTGRLPLLQATVSETLRLRPPAPLGLPHCALRHTSLGGLPIVAGTILVPNLLAAQQDPVIWQQPEAFLPGTWVPLHPRGPSKTLGFST
ncbi:steroid 21-hydroxylase-like [Manacus vitellinus]|uniref:steroid 21-hydroxylase-like n=1 Tax=Manacus vitellinus TaxID=328815 RepID=UPI00115CA2CD|nr:steroid 21-hydroxylase-like [Manacus vitellinus]